MRKISCKIHEMSTYFNRYRHQESLYTKIGHFRPLLGWVVNLTTLWSLFIFRLFGPKMACWGHQKSQNIEIGYFRPLLGWVVNLTTLWSLFIFRLFGPKMAGEVVRHSDSCPKRPKAATARCGRLWGTGKHLDMVSPACNNSHHTP